MGIGVTVVLCACQAHLAGTAFHGDGPLVGWHPLRPSPCGSGGSGGSGGSRGSGSCWLREPSSISKPGSLEQTPSGWAGPHRGARFQMCGGSTVRCGTIRYSSCRVYCLFVAGHTTGGVEDHRDRPGCSTIGWRRAGYFCSRRRCSRTPPIFSPSLPYTALRTVVQSPQSSEAGLTTAHIELLLRNCSACPITHPRPHPYV